MSELALQLIAENKKTQSPVLDLGNCGLTELPEAVLECVWLEKLILSGRWQEYNFEKMYWETKTSGNKGKGNMIALLPDRISVLSSLRNLIINSNQILDISRLSGLSNLETLDCSFNQISEISDLSALRNLQALDCSSNQISDISALSTLTNLQALDCNSNQISDISALSDLTNLQYLSFDENQISDISALSTLTNLQYLSFDENQISDISALSDLTNLQSLLCSSNQISDISAISGLIQLRSFWCDSNQISDISAVLPLINNGVHVMWGMLHWAESIYIHGNPLIIPPIEFAQAGNAAILEYFDQLGDNRTPLNEIKVIFLGEGAAGKTSLVKRIRKESFDAKEGQTHGIRILKTDFVIGEETINAHIWDFGGQEVMHATHQFFLSQRCIYVLVLNSRTDEKAEYWLKHANSFGGNSPVLVVLNKMDENPGYDVNRKQLLEKYPQIVDFFKVSCKEDTEVEEFKNALTAQIARSDTRRTPFPKAWAAVKEHFTNMTEDYIDSAVFQKICTDLGVTGAFSQEVLLQFLHDLGVVINFKHLKNFDTQILNPLWLTNGVYRVINSKIVADNKGVLHEDAFNSVINDKRYTEGNTQDKIFHYPKDKLAYIIKVMEVFELCSRLDAETWVVPQLLPVDEPEFTLEGATLHFVLRFPDFLPDSVFPRLMVKLHPYIKDGLRWRTGMVLYKPTVFKAHARIRADKEDKEIRMDLCGEEPRRLLSFIRETIREIAAGFAKLEYEEMVPVTGTNEFVRYKYLTDAEGDGETSIYIPGKGRVSIAHLLDGVEDAAMRSESALIPVKVFISYAPKDVDHLNEFKVFLSPLERLGKLKIWDDNDIEAGAEREKEIFRELEEADIVLCLISADFIHSKICYSEQLNKALDGHRNKKKVVVPLHVRECPWDSLEIAKIKGLPVDKWISDDGVNRDKAWTEVVRYLEPVVTKIKEDKLREKISKNLPF